MLLSHATTYGSDVAVNPAIDRVMLRPESHATLNGGDVFANPASIRVVPRPEYFVKAAFCVLHDKN